MLRQRSEERLSYLVYRVEYVGFYGRGRFARYITLAGDDFEAFFAEPT
jgi:hypothetical protein